MAFQNLLELYTLTIGSGGTLSGSAYLNGNGIVGMVNAGTWTASVMTLQVSLGSVGPDAGGTWVNVFDTAGEYQLPASVLANGSQYISISPPDLPSSYWVRLRSGASAGGTAQTAQRDFVLFTRPI